MRKRDRERIIKNIDVDIEPKQGRPISVRPYDEDHKKLAEISTETGENKVAIVRRMIHFALNERQQHFAVGRCKEKLDWVVRTGRQNEIINLSLVRILLRSERAKKEMPPEARMSLSFWPVRNETAASSETDIRLQGRPVLPKSDRSETSACPSHNG